MKQLYAVYVWKENRYIPVKWGIPLNIAQSISKLFNKETISITTPTWTQKN